MTTNREITMWTNKRSLSGGLPITILACIFACGSSGAGTYTRTNGTSTSDKHCHDTTAVLMCTAGRGIRRSCAKPTVPTCCRRPHGRSCVRSKPTHSRHLRGSNTQTKFLQLSSSKLMRTIKHARRANRQAPAPSTKRTLTMTMITRSVSSLNTKL